MRINRSVCLVAIAVAWLSRPCAADEPDYQAAAEWWRELPKKWTPLGWKNHLFRYNVLFNGAIVAEPALNRRTKDWSGHGVLVWPSLANPADDGTVRQGWIDCEAPVLWTDWSQSHYAGAKGSGLRLRQEVFAHVPGAGDVKTGIEPLVAWVRLSVEPGAAGFAAGGKFAVAYKIYGPRIGRTMHQDKNLAYPWQPYPRKLSFRPAEAGAGHGLVLEPDGSVRMAVAGEKGCKLNLRSDKEQSLELEFDARRASWVDLVVPMISLPRADVEKECTLGREKALAEANAYWRRVPAAAATICVPEEGINRAITSYLKMAELVAEKDPATGQYCTLTGSWTYADVWATPNAMLYAMLLDPMGYHDAAARYLEVFRKHQGTTVPPGKAYRAHPGYLGTPKVYQAINWLTDNGALLWAFSEHALLAGDRGFIELYTPAIVKSCEWIRDARRMTGHGGIEGILPAAVATDEGKPVQSIWNDGWNYKGLSTAVRLLKRIKHPRAGELEAEAREYREKFRTAFFRVSKDTPTWTDAAGRVHRLAPRSLSGDKDWGIGHAFYLDGGPLFLVFAGLMDADDEPMASTRAWFREGPPRKTYQDNGNCWQRPSLEHEISSCEPCYSWVFFHSWQQGDRPKFLEGMYSLFAGASSRQTYTVCETRGGITGVTPCLPGVWLARLAMIDDQIRPDELHLLRLAPLAWLRGERASRLENMPTEYGPVSLTAGLGPDRQELVVSFAPRFRVVPQRVLLHVPPLPGLRAIRFNGKPLAWDGHQPAVEVRAFGAGLTTPP